MSALFGHRGGDSTGNNKRPEHECADCELRQKKSNVLGDCELLLIEAEPPSMPDGERLCRFTVWTEIRVR